MVVDRLWLVIFGIFWYACIVSLVQQCPYTPAEPDEMARIRARVKPVRREDSPELLLQAALIVPGGKTDEGIIIEAITPAWREILVQLERDPGFLFKIPPRKMEEIIAAAYERDGWEEVILTPRSGDDGRDVIATKPGFGSVRFVDQVKAYSPHRLITADDVRSMMGVLLCDRNVSKGVVSTTSDFAPGIRKHPKINAFIPHRLELRNGQQLQEWFGRLRD